MAEQLRPFHLAIPVNNLSIAKKWYGKVMGCTTGRITSKWIDFNFFGHQLVAHFVPANDARTVTSRVDGEMVPSRHFGVILTPGAWKKLVTRLQGNNIEFIIQPQTRFSGKPGEQSTFFIEDPFGNALEFKAFKDDDEMFAV